MEHWKAIQCYKPGLFNFSVNGIHMQYWCAAPPRNTPCQFSAIGVDPIWDFPITLIASAAYVHPFLSPCHLCCGTSIWATGACPCFSLQTMCWPPTGHQLDSPIIHFLAKKDVAWISTAELELNSSLFHSQTPNTMPEKCFIQLALKIPLFPLYQCLTPVVFTQSKIYTILIPSSPAKWNWSKPFSPSLVSKNLGFPNVSVVLQLLSKCCYLSSFSTTAEHCLELGKWIYTYSLWDKFPCSYVSLCI